VTDQPVPSGATPNYAELTADIVAAYVANNSVRPADLPDLIAAVQSALRGGSTPAKPWEAKRAPAVDPKKSVTPEYIISLEDGRRYQSLKRHLRGRGLTPQEYRKKWDLPHDYPMVAANYAKKRSEVAKRTGLGQARRRALQKAVALKSRS
jgi:predicted transcriptional regulator